MSVSAAVIGASGYAGAELFRILSRHSGVEVRAVDASGNSAGTRVADLMPALSGCVEGTVEPLDFTALKRAGVDVLFFSTPHEYSRQMVPLALASGFRVVDLSGAWRLRCDQNRRVYGFEDDHGEEAQRVQESAVYGLPELHAERIAQAQLVANPGCYATTVILALAPVLSSGRVNASAGVIADAKSGVSGAGRTPTATTHFVNVAENLSAYGLYGHRHTGELVEQLGVSREQMTFTPHLLPIRRGILATNYVTLNERASEEEIAEMFAEFYRSKPLVRVRGTTLPTIHFVAHTNFCDIGFALSPEGRRLTVVSCLDNLLKGAAGQAVQNMNLMFGLPENEGLI